MKTHPDGEIEIEFESPALPDAAIKAKLAALYRGTVKDGKASL